MQAIKDLAHFILLMIGLVGWLVIGVAALILSPVIIGMVAFAAVVFEPDMDGY